MVPRSLCTFLLFLPNIFAETYEDINAFGEFNVFYETMYLNAVSISNSYEYKKIMF